tara:strand:- start:93 stop:2372 length:2280 start_codon:yes stop_codon:yes gene_type:complete
MKKSGCVILLLISTIFFASAQNEGNIWYFGENAGLDFNSGTPVALTDGMMNTFEGCAAISDNNGNLLFYTEGMTVYNKNHIVMPNGLGLLGHSSSTQSSIIVKKPESLNIYYIFTVDGFTGNGGGLNYSEIDMTLDGGLGDVNANKNINLIPFTCEKVTAVVHHNSSDFWIVSPELNTNIIHSFLLTSSGVNLPSIQINAVSPVDGVGYLRSSANGERIAIANSLSNNVELYEFDNSTGILTFQLVISGNNSAYGVEFSPNSDIVYISDWGGGELWQYNLLAGSSQDVIDSELYLGSGGGGPGGALQLAPDNKIYQAIGGSASLPAINNPDIIGLGCNYDINGVFLAGKTSSHGLPTFYSSIFLSNTVDFINFCYGDSTFFRSVNTSLDSVLWDFGDINSGNSNLSTDTSTYHIFSDTGSFDVTLYSYLNGIIDTSITPIYINSLPDINLGIDTAICIEDTLIIDVTLQDASYLWSDNSTNPNYTLFSAGDYSVIITDSNGCINSDTINVVLNPLTYINLGDDIEICEDKDVLILDVYLENASYLWNDNSTSSTFNIDATGVYSVILTDSNGCINSDTINVIINPLPNSDFTFDPQQTDLNNPDILFANLSSINISYQWNFGDGTIIENLNNINHTYQFSGEYDVSLISLNEFGCVDTIIYQIIIDPGGFDLFIPNTFTPNNDEHNELFVIKGRYIIDFNIKIFNRWGKKIFESDNIEKYWDGRFKGKLVQEEKYTYLVTVLDINSDTHEFTGIVNVIY